MTYPDVSGLPVNNDATYPDDPDNPSRKLHQQHHDTVHAAVKAVPVDFLSKADASSTYAAKAGDTYTGTHNFSGATVLGIEGGGGSGLPTGDPAGSILVSDGTSYVDQLPVDAAAGDIDFTPAGTIAATNVQAAVAEVASDAAAALTAHEAAANPHPIYLTQAEADALYSGGGGGSAITVQDEGSALATAATTINFVGAGVTASGTGATKTVTIPGGGLEAPTDFYLPSGYLAETLSRRGPLGNTSILASGTMRMQAIWLVAGQVVSAVTLHSGSTAANTPTNQWVALYDGSLGRLATSGNRTTEAWANNTIKAFDFTPGGGGSGAYTVATTGIHYIGVVVTATTVPSMYGLGSQGPVNQLPPAIAGNSSTGQTTPDLAPATAASITATGALLYALVS